MRTPTDKTFEIVTVNDFLSLDADQADLCLKEFTEFLKRMIAVKTLLQEEHPERVKLLNFNKFNWIDDGKTDCKVNLKLTIED